MSMYEQCQRRYEQCQRREEQTYKRKKHAENMSDMERPPTQWKETPEQYMTRSVGMIAGEKETPKRVSTDYRALEASVFIATTGLKLPSGM